MKAYLLVISLVKPFRVSAIAMSKYLPIGKCRRYESAMILQLTSFERILN